MQSAGSLTEAAKRPPEGVAVAAAVAAAAAAVAAAAVAAAASASSFAADAASRVYPKFHGLCSSTSEEAPSWNQKEAEDEDRNTDFCGVREKRGGFESEQKLWRRSNKCSERGNLVI